MKTRTALVLGMAFSLILISAGLIFSQEAATEPPAEPVTVEGTAIPEAQDAPDIQWLWGEAVSVSTENKEILVKYLDYETDQEKEISISVDEDTAYENIDSIEGIKPQDNLSVDYIASSEGKNIAKNISLDKPESQEVALPEAPTEIQPEAAAEETVPEEIQPEPEAGQ